MSFFKLLDEQTHTHTDMIRVCTSLKEPESNHTLFLSGNGKDSAQRFRNDSLFNDNNCVDLH
jgi:hypothetical protein